jgi:hypothetical protein
MCSPYVSPFIAHRLECSLALVTLNVRHQLQVLPLHVGTLVACRTETHVTVVTLVRPQLEVDQIHVFL